MQETFQVKDIGIKTLLTIGFILFLNTIASFFYWYSTIWWFDIPMHFLGGFFIALFSFWLFSTYLIEFFNQKSITNIVLSVLGIVFIVGLGWEVYEIMIDYMTGALGYVYLDGISDLFNDMAGGCIGILYLLRSRK